MAERCRRPAPPGPHSGHVSTSHHHSQTPASEPPFAALRISPSALHFFLTPFSPSPLHIANDAVSDSYPPHSLRFFKEQNPNGTNEWQRKLRDFALRLEEALYRGSRTKVLHYLPSFPAPRLLTSIYSFLPLCVGSQRSSLPPHSLAPLAFKCFAMPSHAFPCLPMPSMLPTPSMCPMPSVPQM